MAQINDADGTEGCFWVSIALYDLCAKQPTYIFDNALPLWALIIGSLQKFPISLQCTSHPV